MQQRARVHASRGSTSAHGQNLMLGTLLASKVTIRFAQQILQQCDFIHTPLKA